MEIWALEVPPVPPTGLPSALLERRPDIRQAEETLVAANAQIGVAKAALLPKISLTGALGGESTALSSLVQSGARIWSIGFGLVMERWFRESKARKLGALACCFGFAFLMTALPLLFFVPTHLLLCRVMPRAGAPREEKAGQGTFLGKGE